MGTVTLYPSLFIITSRSQTLPRQEQNDDPIISAEYAYDVPSLHIAHSTVPEGYDQGKIKWASDNVRIWLTVTCSKAYDIHGPMDWAVWELIVTEFSLQKKAWIEVATIQLELDEDWDDWRSSAAWPMWNAETGAGPLILRMSHVESILEQKPTIIPQLYRSNLSAGDHAKPIWRTRDFIVSFSDEKSRTSPQRRE